MSREGLTFHFCNTEEPVAACERPRHHGYRLTNDYAEVTCSECETIAREAAQAQTVIEFVKSSRQRKRIDWGTRRLVPAELARLVAKGQAMMHLDRTLWKGRDGHVHKGLATTLDPRQVTCPVCQPVADELIARKVVNTMKRKHELEYLTPAELKALKP